ncbi:MAG: AraC family transcriptional regulator [Pseudomonadota bacterium]
MRRPHKTMPDVTLESLDDVLDVGDGTLLKADTNRSVVASGGVRAIPISEGLYIHMAELRGQAAFEADLSSVSGLVLEVRLDGVSTSLRAGETELRRIQSGFFAMSAGHTPKLWHVSVPAQDGFRTVSITFSHDFLQKVGDAALSGFVTPMFDDGACRVDPASPAALALAEQLLVIDSETPLANIRLQSTCLSLLADCVSSCLEKPSDASQYDQRVIAEAKTFIRQNADKSLTISEVAAHCRLSASSLKILFQKGEGTSLGRHIRTVRMQTARTMLENGVPIVNVSRVLNYSAPEALTRAFSNHFGFPPSQAAKKLSVSIK